MENDRKTVACLNEKDFELALANGLGRAMLHVTHYGIDDVVNLVLDACLHDQTYDPQCEDSRANWLFSMFNCSSHYPKFREIILGALGNETDTWDLSQLCQLSKEMAANGDIQARQALRARIIKIASTPSDYDWVGTDEWVELEGVEGLLELARVYGQRLLQNRDDSVNDDLLLVAENESNFKEILFQHSEKEPSIKAFWDYLEKRDILEPVATPVDRETMKQQSRERFRRRHTLERIINDARTEVGQFAGHYAGFGRYATTEELEEIYTHLLNETDESVILRLLWVFRGTPIPRLNARFFKWAKGTDQLLRAASIAALAQVSDEQIHDLAKFKLKETQLLGADDEALDLFIYNYEPNDAHLITQALLSIEPKAEEAHSLGYSVLRVVEQQGDATLTDALKWVYENTPCTNCRYRAIVHLDGFRQFDNTLIQECLFDTSEEIRDFAQERSTQSLDTSNE